MAKQDARGWEFQVLDREEIDGEENPVDVWVEIGGINTFDLDPSANEEITETTDFQSDGEWEGEKMQVGASVQIEGFWKYDDETGEHDRGQALLDAYAKKKSTGSHAAIRMRHETETEWSRWRRAVITAGSRGGGNNDKTSWSATAQRSGKADVMEVQE